MAPHIIWKVPSLFHPTFCTPTKVLGLGAAAVVRGERIAKALRCFFACQKVSHFAPDLVDALDETAHCATVILVAPFSNANHDPRNDVALGGLALRRGVHWQKAPHGAFVLRVARRGLARPTPSAQNVGRPRGKPRREGRHEAVQRRGGITATVAPTLGPRCRPRCHCGRARGVRGRIDLPLFLGGRQFCRRPRYGKFRRSFLRTGDFAR